MPYALGYTLSLAMACIVLAGCQDSAIRKSQIEINDVRIVDTLDNQGAKGQEILVSWTNRSWHTIRRVEAKINVFNDQGEQTGSFEATIYDAPSSEPGVAPNQSHTPKLSEGFVLPASITATKAAVEITTALEHSKN